MYKSKPSYVCDDQYRRRRQCADCGEDWPTQESLDVGTFERDLARRGLRWEDGQVVAGAPKPVT